jgi:hypothetical protein
MGDNLRSLIVGDRPRNATIVLAVATRKELEVGSQLVHGYYNGTLPSSS